MTIWADRLRTGQKLSQVLDFYDKLSKAQSHLILYKGFHTCTLSKPVVTRQRRYH